MHQAVIVIISVSRRTLSSFSFHDFPLVLLPYFVIFGVGKIRKFYLFSLPEFAYYAQVLTICYQSNLVTWFQFHFQICSSDQMNSFGCTSFQNSSTSSSQHIQSEQMLTTAAII
uniref:Uncharacterized protein n=1 Tax=Glossina pallidipes TaxID=7398 RepID=A0A1B0AAI8_GLOPL